MVIRIAVIGTNFITERFIDAMSELTEYELTAVYSRTKERAVEFASKYGDLYTYTSLEELASSPHVDAVYIASPTSFHADQAEQMLKGGKHVLVEKPAASNDKEWARMTSAAYDNQVVLMEAMKTTQLPNFILLKEHLHKLGPVRSGFANYCQYSSRYDAYKEGNVLNAFNPELSNGSLMDIGVYGIYPIIALFGRPREVKAQGHLLESGVDGSGSLLLKYEDSQIIINHSKITDSMLPSEIQGEHGNVVIQNWNNFEKLTFYDRTAKSETLLSEPQHTNPMYYEAVEFAKLIQEGKNESTLNSHKNTALTLQVLDEARRQIGLVFPSDS
ncbi:Gfo/Idh/MocA family protein [Alkalicoccobacillus porphyridii]|uniref:Gfo/Idh/MocA family oxidoreductase n=1 Tax=Alkalicoccobacillus porphyridii TaxID=2597270 RepID=A0A553ZVP2_9BACI|nr:Gfo/Idh/MocA family oxidoreductase [Alkalicoccobacillus porphyridii]TSB45502.1 Gfo/Idh/MocA family oxidoreductase [Alkalicoccobacillus porphyridii]